MPRRATQAAAARCPWCEATLHKLAVECPRCRFPLTMAAAEGGFQAAEHSGTTSTATPAGRGVVPIVGRADPGRSRVHGSRAHRIRVVAWLVGLSSILLLLAGVGAVVSTSSPGARSDREAMSGLATALHRATDDPAYRQEAPVVTISGDEASDQASRVSTSQSQGFWFGAARSTSGRCFLLAARASDATPLGRGTLANDEPCSAARVQLHLEDQLVKADRRP